MIFVIPIIAFGLSAPVFSSENDKTSKFFSYVLWVLVQWVIFY